MTVLVKWIWAIGVSLFAASLPCSAELTSESLRSPRKSQYLEDVARYLTGDEKDAETVYLAYKRRISPGDPALPYPISPPAIPIPERLDDLWKDLGLDEEEFAEPPTEKWKTSQSKGWVRRLVRNSGVKGRGRVIYRRKGRIGPRISIAQTWNLKTGKARETEIAIQRKDSPDWDFFVYGPDGKLSATSLFHSRGGKNIEGPAPLTCLTCHYDRDARRFTYTPKSYVFADSLTALLEQR